jgi:hypothetical protein
MTLTDLLPGLLETGRVIFSAEGLQDLELSLYAKARNLPEKKMAGKAEACPARGAEPNVC